MRAGGQDDTEDGGAARGKGSPRQFPGHLMPGSQGCGVCSASLGSRPRSVSLGDESRPWSHGFLTSPYPLRERDRAGAGPSLAIASVEIGV